MLDQRIHLAFLVKVDLGSLQTREDSMKVEEIKSVMGVIDSFQCKCIELLSMKFIWEIQNFIKCLKFKNNYRYLGIGSEKELELALNNYDSWKGHCEEKMRIISISKLFFYNH